jgi:hypothetical protein
MAGMSRKNESQSIAGNEADDEKETHRTMKYTLISTKETRVIEAASESDAIKAAIKMEQELQPAWGVTVEDSDGDTVAEIRDGKWECEDTETDTDNDYH